MATPVPDTSSTSPDDNDTPARPDHFIIWLDQHIGKPDECVLLKANFVLTMDPTNPLFERKLTPSDIDLSICMEVELLVRLDEVEFLFQAFVDVEKCFHKIENNLHKRIFFITSGSKGKIIVPSLIANFPNTFESEYWIYVFYANMRMTANRNEDVLTNTWALNFVENILMFNHQDDLLARMVMEAGNYFFERANSLQNRNEFTSAYNYYRWSKKMYERYQTMEKTKLTAKIAEIDKRIRQLQSLIDEQEEQKERTGQATS